MQDVASLLPGNPDPPKHRGLDYAGDLLKRTPLPSRGRGRHIRAVAK